MRYFLDTEFDEAPGKLVLISLALVAENGREFYAVSSEYDPAQCNEWVKANVLPKLPTPTVAVDSANARQPKCKYVRPWMTRKDIAAGIRSFIGDDTPEFWGYFTDYDWVAFCWLFGPMVDLPETWPRFCLDLKQEMVRRGISKMHLPPQPNADEAHDALVDARWIRDAWNALHAITGERTMPMAAACATAAHGIDLDALERDLREAFGEAPWERDSIEPYLRVIARVRALEENRAEHCKAVDTYAERAFAAELHARALEEERDEARAWVRRLTAEQRLLTCAFCGEAYPPGTPDSNDSALTAHVRVCQKHPMREAEERIRALEAFARSEAVRCLKCGAFATRRSPIGLGYEYTCDADARPNAQDIEHAGVIRTLAPTPAPFAHCHRCDGYGRIANGLSCIRCAGVRTREGGA